MPNSDVHFKLLYFGFGKFRSESGRCVIIRYWNFWDRVSDSYVEL